MTNTLRIAGATLLIVLASGPRSSAQTPVTVTRILGFTNSNGAYPFGGLVSSSNGTLYGATFSGGTYGYGVIYELTPQSGGTWTPTIVLDFANPATSGANPYGGLLIGANGTLYGTTTRGGSHGAGTVFALAPPAQPGGSWTESLLYSFGAANDGSYPYGGLVMDRNAVLYGTTVGGGTSGLGTVFSLANSTGAWVETVLHSFVGGADGANPYAALALSTTGTLYGTTPYGGLQGSGTLFALTQYHGAWVESGVFSFAGGSGGANPYAGLLIGLGGQIYGTTTNGGTSGAGTVFQFTQKNGAWSQQVIYNLPPYAACYGTLVTDPSGLLYGATPGSHGASANDGIIFKLTPPQTLGGSWTETTLYGFPGALGNGPRAGLLWAPNNGLYGTTVGLGPDGLGMVFQLTF